jgi:hypothetical protein
MLQGTTAGSTRQSNRAFQQLTPPGEVHALFGAVLGNSMDAAAVLQAGLHTRTTDVTSQCNRCFLVPLEGRLLAGSAPRAAPEPLLC